MIISNLAVLLAERGLKMADVIRDTGIAKTTIRALYYNTSKGIQYDTLDTLCKYLKITPNDLLAREYLEYEFEVDVDKIKASIRHNTKSLTEELDLDVDFDINENDQIDDLSIDIYVSQEMKNLLASIPTIFRTALEDELTNQILDMVEREYATVVDGDDVLMLSFNISEKEKK